LSVSCLLNAMLLDVSADHLRRDLVTDRTSTIAIFPEFSAPQAPLHAWELTTDSPGTHTLAPCHDLCEGVSWWEGAKERDMVRTHLQFLNGDVVLLRNISKKLLDSLWYLALQDIASILRRPDQVGEGIVDGMGCTSEDQTAVVPPQPIFGSGHRARSQRPSFPPPQAAGQPERFSHISDGSHGPGAYAVPALAHLPHKLPHRVIPLACL
jgi:hypothetical protein